MNREELYRIWKAEKSEKTLQKLSSNFYSEVARLLNDSKTKSATTGQDRTQAAISKKEFNILQRLSTEIVETRMEKIVEAALSRRNVAFEGLSKEEAEFAKQMAIHVGDHYRFIDDVARGELVSEERFPTKEAETRLEVVRFLSDFPAIVGVDLRTYGPFKVEDVASIPVENASALISQGVVKQVRYSEGVAPAR